MTSYPDISSIPIVGGNLALDLANTTSERHGPAPRERLHGPGDVVTWAERVGLAGRRDAAMLRKEAAAQPGRAARAVDRLLALREVIYRLFSSVAAGTDPDLADLAALDRAWHDSATRRRLVWSAGGVGWQREEEDGLADRKWTDASDRAVDSRVVLVRTHDRLHHFWRGTR